MAKPKKARGSKKEYVPTPEQEARDKVQLPPMRVQKDGSIVLEHPDEATGARLLLDALGTADSRFTVGLISDLVQISKVDGKTLEGNLNFALSIVRGVEPKNVLESMLAAQMVVVHQTLMDYRQHFPKL